MPSQLKAILEGAKIELDNKALEAFKYNSKDEETKEIPLSSVFADNGKVLESCKGNESIIYFIR